MNEIAQIGHSIGDLGMLVMVAALFLVAVWLLFRNFLSTSKAANDLLMEEFHSTMKSLLENSEKQSKALSELASYMKPAADIQIRNIVNTYFDLYKHNICHLIQEIRIENHLTDHEATRNKIMIRVNNLFQKRNSEFDYFHFRNRPLSEYADTSWVNKMARLVEEEVYNKDENNVRTYNAVKSLVEENRMAFLKRINGI